MMLIAAVGGTPLPVPKNCASAAAAIGAGLAAASVAAKEKPHRLSLTLKRP